MTVGARIEQFGSSEGNFPGDVSTRQIARIAPYTGIRDPSTWLRGASAGHASRPIICSFSGQRMVDRVAISSSLGKATI